MLLHILSWFVIGDWGNVINRWEVQSKDNGINEGAVGSRGNKFDGGAVGDVCNVFGVDTALHLIFLIFI